MTSQPHESKDSKLKLVTPKEFFAAIAGFARIVDSKDLIDGCAFDSPEMQIYVSIFYQTFTPSSYKSRLTIYTGSVYQSKFGSQSNAHREKKDFLRSLLDVSKHLHTIDLLLDPTDVDLTTFGFLEYDKSQPNYNFFIDTHNPGYMDARNKLLDTLPNLKEIPPNFITIHDIRGFFQINHTSYRHDFIYTNTPSTTPVLSRALAKKPWYKHKRLSHIADTDIKTIFIVSDYIWNAPDSLRGINLNFYKRLFSVGYKSFLWTGDPKSMIPVKYQEQYPPKFSFQAQHENAINIELIRKHLSQSMSMQDKEIIIITAKKRIHAIKSIFGSKYQRIQRTNPEFFKIYPDWKLPQPNLTVSDQNVLLIKSKPSSSIDDISFRSLHLSLLTQDRIETLFEFIDTKNRIEHIHFEILDWIDFALALKNCPRVKTIYLDIALHEENIEKLESLETTISTKIVELHIVRLTHQPNDLLHVCKLTHLINLRRLTLSAPINFDGELSLPPSLKYLHFDNCSLLEKISPTELNKFTTKVQKTHPNLIIEISYEKKSDKVFIRRALSADHKLPQLHWLAFDNCRIHPTDQKHKSQRNQQPSTAATGPYNPSSLHSPKTGLLTTTTGSCKTRFYTSDTSLTLPPSRMNQDAISQLTIQEDKKQIGFIAATSDFLPEKDQRKFYRFTYEQYASHEHYLTLRKSFKFPQVVCGKVDAVSLEANHIYILPTPHADAGQSWELANIAFEPPDFARRVEIGRCRDIENAYALRLKDSKSEAQIFKAYMILYPSQSKALSIKNIPSTSRVKSEIYPILKWLANKPNIKKHFPNFTKLISELDALQLQKTRLCKLDPHFQSLTTLTAFWQIIQAQCELLQAYCQFGKGFKVGALNIDWDSLLEKRELALLEQCDGMKALLNNALSQQGECERAAQSFVFIATGYGLPVLKINNSMHAYVKTLCPKDKNPQQLCWLPRDLGGAPREYKEEPFFLEELKQKSKPTPSELKIPQSVSSNHPSTIAELKQKSQSSLNEFKRFQSPSLSCKSVTEFIALVLAETSPLLTYSSDNLSMLEGFLIALCQRFRSQHQSFLPSSTQSASQILRSLTNHTPLSSSLEESKLPCWIKLLTHPDDLDILWETHQIRDNRPQSIQSPLQKQIPSLVILDISAFSVGQLEVHANLLQPSPSLLYQSRLYSLPASCQILYLCNEQQYEWHLSAFNDLQCLNHFSWPEALNADFLTVREAEPLIKQFDFNNLSEPSLPEQKSPAMTPVVHDLSTIEPTAFLTEDPQIDDSKIVLIENSAVLALKAHQPLIIQHTFDAKNLAIFRQTALRKLVLEQDALQNGEWSLLPPNPMISLIRLPVKWPERLVEIQDAAQWIAWRSHETVTSYVLNTHSHPHFIRNWQADIKTRAVTSTSLPGIVGSCKTARALIQVTDFFPDADWFALYQQILQLREDVSVAICFHPHYRRAPGLEQARKAPEMKAMHTEDAKPKVFFAGDTDLSGALHYLKTNKHLPEDICVIPINGDTTQEELFESFKTYQDEDFTSGLQWRIDYQKNEVMTLLEQGNVLLMGQISSELYSQLESLIVSDYLWSNAQRLTFDNQLFMLSPPNPQLAKHLAPFFDTQPIVVTIEHYMQWLDETSTLNERDKKNLQQAYEQTHSQLRWSWPRAQEVAKFLQQYPHEHALYFKHSPMQVKLLEDYDPLDADYARFRNVLLTSLCSEEKSIADSLHQVAEPESDVKPTSTQLTPPDSTPLITDQTEVTTDDDKKQCVTDKVQEALALLQQHDSLALLGSAGTGKTFTVRVLLPAALTELKKTCRLYIGEGGIEPWLQADDADVIHIALVDEVNIFPPSFLQPLMQPDTKRFWRGKAYTHQAEHWLIGTGNPRLSYSGRFPVPEGMPTLWFQPFTPADIYNFQIAPFLEKVMKIDDASLRRSLADIYLDSYHFVRRSALVSPRNLNRILYHMYALQSQYAEKNSTSASTELLTAWIRQACYHEFKSLAPAHFSAQNQAEFIAQLISALKLEQIPKLSISSKLSNMICKDGIAPVQPIISLLYYLQKALQIREITLKNQLEPSGYGILFQSTETKFMRECVTRMLAEKKLSYSVLSVNPEDEEGFKQGVRQSLQQKNILVLNNPHLITPDLEKWLNPLLEGMDVEQALETSFPREFYIIFLHRENRLLSTAIKNRLQIIQLETCTGKDWQCILEQYTQNTALRDLVVSCFALLLQEHTQLDKPALRNPEDLIKLCDRLKEKKWFEKSTSFQHEQWQQLYQTLMTTFCIRWKASEQRSMHDSLEVLHGEWIKQQPADTKHPIQVLDKKVRLVRPSYQLSTASAILEQCQNCIAIGESLRQNDEVEQATHHFDLANATLQKYDIENSEIWQRLRQAYYDTRLNPNHLEWVNQNLKSALEIDQRLAQYGEVSIKMQIIEALSQINISDAEEDESGSHPQIKSESRF